MSVAKPQTILMPALQKKKILRLCTAECWHIKIEFCKNVKKKIHVKNIFTFCAYGGSWADYTKQKVKVFKTNGYIYMPMHRN